MPVGFNSPARNLFLLGSSGAQVVTNFFKTIDKTSGTDRVYRPDEIRYNDVDQKYLLSGSAENSSSKGFGWFEKRDVNGNADWDIRIESTQPGSNTTLRAMEIDGNGNFIVAGKTGDIPWISKYSDAGVISWQSSSQTGNLGYTGIAIDQHDNIYACGTDNTGAFIEKIDANGVYYWGKSSLSIASGIGELNEGNGGVNLFKCSANSRGEVVAVGTVEDTIKQKGYILKLDTNTGEVLWDRTLEDHRVATLSSYWHTNCYDVFVDTNDQIYVVGSVFDYIGVKSRGFIIKYSPEGNIIWQKETQDTFDKIEFYQVKSDGQTQQTIVAGRFFDENNDENIMLSKYSKDGSLVWRRKLYSSRDEDMWNVNLDADPSFYYLIFTDKNFEGLSGTPKQYIFGKVSSSGNGLGDFEYYPDGSSTLDYKILGLSDNIGKLSDGSVRNDSSDFITYPFSPNGLVFDDLATLISNKKVQINEPDTFEYSGSPAIRPADFQELNLLGNVYSGSGNWLDQSGKGNDGVVNGATWNASGWWEFDGVNDSIVLPNLEVNYSTNLTLEAWVKTSETSNTWNQIVCGPCADILWAVYVTGGVGKLNFGTQCNSPIAHNKISTTTINDNNWYHVITTYDGTNIKHYINGVLDSTYPETASIVPSGNLRIGSNSAENGELMNGQIGEVRVYPRALTPAQVFQNYNATKSKYTNEAPVIAPKLTDRNIIIDTDLLLYYDFGNKATYDTRLSATYGNPTTVKNLTSNLSTGTINGATFNTAGYFEFDGNNDYISVPQSDPLDFYFLTNSFPNWTMEAWIYRNSAWNANWWQDAILACDDGPGQLGKWIFSYNGSLMFHSNTTTGNSRTDTAPRSWTPSTGQWYHVVVAGNSTRTDFYQNLEYLGSSHNGAITNAVKTAPMTIGIGEGTSTSFNGRIASVRLYDRKLSGSEIRKNYLATRANYGNPYVPTVPWISTDMMGYVQTSTNNSSSQGNGSGSNADHSFMFFPSNYSMSFSWNQTTYQGGTSNIKFIVDGVEVFNSGNPSGGYGRSFNAGETLTIQSTVTATDTNPTDGNPGVNTLLVYANGTRIYRHQHNHTDNTP